MNVSRISAKTLSTLRKEQIRNIKLTNKLSEEQRLDQYIKNTAKSIIPDFKYRLNLNIGDSSNSMDTSKYKISTLEYSESVWAPWSNLNKKNNK